MSKALFLLLLSSIFMLQSCVSYNWIRNEQSVTYRHSYQNDCNVKFSLDFVDVKGEAAESVTFKKTSLQDYINDTKEVFASKQCLATYVDKEADANFKITVVINDPALEYVLGTPWDCHAAAGFNGIFFTYLPTWCKQTGVDKFFFENIPNKKYTYLIDERVFFHGVFIPLFWINFLTHDNNLYKKALANFIDFSERDSLLNEQ